LAEAERSLRWFQSYLGLSKRIEQSGDSYQLNFGGSKIKRLDIMTDEEIDLSNYLEMIPERFAKTLVGHD
jgi:hypothetical protein